MKPCHGVTVHSNIADQYDRFDDEQWKALNDEIDQEEKALQAAVDKDKEAIKAKIKKLKAERNEKIKTLRGKLKAAFSAKH